MNEQRTISDLLTWSEAVAAMREGKYVRRAGEMTRRLIEDGDGKSLFTAPVYETGQEGCFLAHAWTVGESSALVFMGHPSKCLFVPDDEHRGATDWLIVEKHQC